MVFNKVEICGVNTSKLPILSNEQKKVLFDRILPVSYTHLDVYKRQVFHLS